MTLGGIQLGGLASGLDTGAIIDAIMAAESSTKNRLEARKGLEQGKLTLLGTFQGLVEKLQDKARDLQLASNFFAHKLQVGAEGFANFTLSGNAEAGAHTLEVFSLAAADRYAFAGVADPKAALGAGTVSFTYDGTDYSVAVASGSDSLEQIAAAINTAAGAKVTASVVNAGTEATPSWQLVLAGDSTGSDFAITNLTSSVAGLTGATHVSTASNASIAIDGLAVQRSSNLFSDVLPGVSFSVTRTTEVGAPLSFTVELDPEGMKENLKGFVDAYNDVIEFVNKQNSFTLEDGKGGELFGDDALEAVRTVLRRAVTPDRSLVTSDTDGYSTLGLIGIDLQTDGTLKIDDDKLDEKLSGDLDLFSDFFRRADDATTTDVDERGLLVKMKDMLDGLLDSSTSPDGKKIDGLFGARRDAIGRQIKDFDNQIERQQDRLDALEQSLVQKFATLEKLMSGLQSQQSFLTSSIASLNK